MLKRLLIVLLMGIVPLVRAETFTVGVEALDYYPYYRIDRGEYTGSPGISWIASPRHRGTISSTAPIP